MGHLEGKTIALTGSRKAEEISRMIAKFGGKTVVRPAQGTVFLDDAHIEEQLKAFVAQPPDWILLTTGVGTDALLQIAGKWGLANQFIETLKGVKVAARGYKTVQALRKIGIKPDIKDNDGTTAGMLDEMRDIDLMNKHVVLQLYGDPAPRILQRLRARGAICDELLPYRHMMPENGSVERLIEETVSGELDVVAFTSTAQVRYVMSKGNELGAAERVLQAFREHTLAVAVGKVTAEALTEEGVERVLYPEEERMGSMVVAMSKYFGSN